MIKSASRAREANEYLRDIYGSVLLKDIVARLKISDVNTLENITQFVLHNIGNKISPARISNTLKSKGRGTDQKTADRYLRGLTDSLMIYEARRYNIKGRQFLVTQSKYYAVDVALRNALVKGKESDAGHILENIVFLEPLRRGDNIYVGQMSENYEVDFVAIGNKEISYYTGGGNRVG
jgi:predicted AAA+ superfamily ATPase